MSRWDITKAILARTIVGKESGKTAWQMLSEEKPVRADSEFPLNMRILSRVNMDITKYLLAEGKLEMFEPASKGTIVEIGTIMHNDGLVDYLARISPDNAIEKDIATLLLVETQHGQVLSTKLFTQANEIFPASIEKWEEWIDDEKGILGSEELTNPNGVKYLRLWGDGLRVEPMRAREKVLTDQFGRNIINNDLVQMMFAREVCDDAGKKLTDEFALVSVVNEECVEILYGVPVTITADNIIGA
ncbi:MAG: DUF2491 family protein [Parcubacteria group bacterium]